MYDGQELGVTGLPAWTRRDEPLAQTFASQNLTGPQVTIPVDRQAHDKPAVLAHSCTWASVSLFVLHCEALRSSAVDRSDKICARSSSVNSDQMSAIAAIS